MSDLPTPDGPPWAEVIRTLDAYAIFRADPNGTITSWNAGVGALFGFEEHEFVGRHGEIIFTAEDRAKGAPELEMRTAVEFQHAQDNRWHVRKDGSRLWVNGVMTALWDENGGHAGFVKVMRDETGAREVEERLRESEERFQKAFRSNPTPIAILQQPVPRIVDVNHAFTEAFRLERPDTIGRTILELGVEVGEEELARVRGEMAAGRSVRLEAAFRRRDGERGYGTFAYEPIELGGEPHAVLLMHDVTRWRRTQNELEQQRAFVTAILASLPGVFYMLEGYRYVRWNDELERVTGRTPEELAAASPDDLVLEGERGRAAIEEALRTGRTSMEGHLRTKDGGLLPYLFTGQRVVLNEKPFIVGVGLDIRHQLRSRRALERRALEQSAFADLAASTLSHDEVLPILDLAARRVADTLGAEHVHVVEFGADGAGSVVRASLRADGATADAPALVAGDRFDSTRTSLLRGDAGPWPEEVLAPLGLKSGIRAPIRGHGERPFGLVEALSEREGAFREDDVRFLGSVAFLVAGAIEQHRLHRALAHRADHDDLTGLPNRTVFERRLVDALARAKRERTKVAVLFLDLDRFKNINDSLGHHAGDAILRNVADRVRDAVRSWDVVARLGGDEFVLFLPDVTSEAEVAHVTERLLEAFEAPFAVAGREVAVGTTVGIAVFPADGEDAAALLRAADTAMYEGKSRGRNSFHFFTREQNAKVSDRLQLEADLRRALERDELEVAYQPQIDLRDDRVRVVEALLRWRHPTRGDLAPDVFLPVAEAIGLTVPIGEWTLRRAFADHVGWRGRPGGPERVAVNVGTLHFVQPTFPRVLVNLAREAGMEPHEIEIELTEATLLKDPDLVEEHLRSLRDLGVHIVLDDFGTGASSLARLRALPIGRLKIDEAFTHALDDGPGRRLVDAVVQIALSLEIEPVAEGIETVEQHVAVRELGFCSAQGRLYAGPCEADELPSFLESRPS